jgi:predicted outer membrane repeat protein
LLAVAIIALSLGTLPSTVQAQSVVYVDVSNTTSECTSASSTNELDGTSWECAYPSLQDALDEANDATGAYEIRVAEGTYYPDIDNVDNDGDGTLEHVDNSRNESFHIQRDDIQVLGGYPSGGGTRNPDANTVTLSGDIDADNGDADDSFAPNTDSDGDASTPTQTDHIRGNNAYHVVEVGGASATITEDTVVDGFVITAGLSDDSFPNNVGGGMYCDATTSSSQCSLRIENVAFRGNAADYGGGLALDVEAPSGGSGQAAPAVVDVRFRGNEARSFWGGAVYIFVDDGGSASPSFQSTVFQNNLAASRGGGVYTAARSGTASQPSFTNVVFLDNRAGTGGGIYNSGLDANSEATPAITNATFTRNKADLDGGALYNQADTDGLSNPQIVNSILWANVNDADNDGSTRGGPEVFNNGAGAQPSISYSIVENGESTGIVDDNGASTTYDTATNLESDPQFIDLNDPDGTDDELATMDDGLRLRGVGFPTPSPAIDAGNNSAVPQDVTEDLIGNNRFYNGDGNPGEEVDIGAYEYSDTPLPVELAAFDADVTDDRSVRLQWQTTSETGNSGFRVQRSVSGTSWSTLGRVEGAGTTDEPQSYRFTDTSVPYASDSLQYRLAQVDVDGTVNVSDPVTVRFGNPDGLELLGSFPNPARSQATVRFAVPEQTTGDVQLELYDLLGRQVKTLPAAEASGRVEQTLDVSDLPSGTYLLRLSAGGQSQSQQVTIVR